MSPISVYLVLSTFAFLFLAVIWNKNGMFNFLLKLSFGVLTLFGSFITLTHFGYLIKV